jgi:hypothetical protein
MSGDDVYDVGSFVWCDLCDAPHDDCEPPDLTFECCNCNKPLPDATSDDPLFPMLECDECCTRYPKASGS